MNFNGIEVVESKYMVKLIQDWSACRSPSRAKRRHARGIKTRMVEREVPISVMISGKLVAHPEVVAVLKAKLTN